MNNNWKFHCGTQFGDWLSAYCDRCKKFDGCEANIAVWNAYKDPKSVPVPDCFEETGNYNPYHCKEFERE